MRNRIILTITLIAAGIIMLSIDIGFNYVRNTGITLACMAVAIIVLAILSLRKPKTKQTVTKRIARVINPTIVSATMEATKNHDYIIKATIDNGREEYTYDYIGSSTVWRTFPGFTRCTPYMETQLSNVCRYIKHYGNPYPTAHVAEMMPGKNK